MLTQSNFLTHSYFNPGLQNPITKYKTPINRQYNSIYNWKEKEENVKKYKLNITKI